MNAQRKMKSLVTHLVFLILLVSELFLSVGCGKSWKDYQQEYLQQISQQHVGKDSSLGRELVIGKILAVENDELGISDKCVSCHLGVANTVMRGASQPLATHSGGYLRSHPMQTYGCVICHRGNGDALKEKEAHEGMLQGELAQISCTKCHVPSSLLEQELAGARDLSNGFRLIGKLGCAGCHRIEGFSNLGQPAPSLVGVGTKVNRKWLVRWLKNPRSLVLNATMPTYHLSDEHVEALAAYLATFRDLALESMNEPARGNSELGGNLLREARCISCHPFNGTGGHLAPDLGKIGNKVSRKWLVQMLQDPKQYQPYTTMPQFNFTASDYSNLADHLFEEYTDYEIKEQDDGDKSLAKTDPETIDIGRRIFKELRCGNCHAFPGEQEWLQLGPVLTFVGDKKVEDLDVGTSGIERTLPEYLFFKMRRPQLFATKTNLLKMPDYRLTQEEAKDITIGLLSLSERKVTSKKFMVLASPASTQEMSGTFGALLNKYQCFSCHRINGRGYNLAYDLSMEGSRVQRTWLYNYLMVSYSIRPILVERMPVFRFPTQEAKVLTDGIMSQFTHPDVPKNLEREFTPMLTKAGERLFDEKGCMACHIVGEKGGYVGPSFTIGAPLGEKLEAGWVYQWLKNAQAIVPSVIEPRYNFSDEEAKALTAYLMSLRAKKGTSRK
jgi:mono/diheme cytochrome c family protein